MESSLEEAQMDVDMSTKIDKNGMPQFKATRTPSEDGKEFDAKRARDLGIPVFARIEIPMNGRYQLRDYARELHELAERMERLSRDLDSDEVYVVMQAHREIRHVSERLRSRRGPKPQHGG
jgi:hypothetical protein